MPALDMRNLPKEIIDKIELKEQVDSTFYRVREEDYSDIFFNTVQQRADASRRHSMIISMTGEQGCHLKGAKVTTLEGLKNIEDVRRGDLVWAGGAWRLCVPIRRGVEKVVRVVLDNHQEFVMTPDHMMRTSSRGWVEARSLTVVDSFVLGDVPWSSDWNEESEKAAVVAMLLADGHLDVRTVGEEYDYVRISNRKMKKTPKKKHVWLAKRVRFYKADASLRVFVGEMLKKHFFANVVGEYVDCGTSGTKVVNVTNERVFDAVCAAGVPVGKKSGIVKIPDWVMKSDAAMNGFLAGYFACDGSFYEDCIEISSCSKELVDQLQVWLQSRGCVVRTLTGKKNGASSDIFRLLIRNKDALGRWVACVRNISLVKKVVLREKSYRRSAVSEQLRVVSVDDAGFGEVFDLQVSGVHEYLVGGVVSHNSGKSFGALALCKMLDPNFDVKTQVYFNYDKLVKDRKSLKPGTAVLMDEQSQSYGLDSHRVMIILAGIKEQLRKKSIHLVFCAPVLYEESKTSMYIIETLYIDYEREECICALKTREGYALGHIRIPSPLKRFDDGGSLFSKEEIELYESHKDEHLDELLGTKHADEWETKAEMVCSDPIFKAVEKIYVNKLGYVPQTMVVQVINKIMPDYHAGVVPFEIAARIKLNKELSGEWVVAGYAKSKKTKDRGR